MSIIADGRIRIKSKIRYAVLTRKAAISTTLAVRLEIGTIFSIEKKCCLKSVVS